MCECECGCICVKSRSRSGWVGMLVVGCWWQGAGDVVVVVGGVIPQQDYDELYAAGASLIFGPGTSCRTSASALRCNGGTHAPGCFFFPGCMRQAPTWWRRRARCSRWSTSVRPSPSKIHPAPHTKANTSRPCLSARVPPTCAHGHELSWLRVHSL